MMTDLPLVTIVTPVHNQRAFVAETIESVLAQDYPAIEYIVVDDGSTDGTSDVLARYRDRVTLITQPNAGQARTLNMAWANAKGDYLGYLSGDDLLEPTTVSRMVEALQASAATVCAYPNAHTIDTASKVIKKHVCRPFDLWATIVSQECYIGPGALFRRDAFRKVGGWRESMKLNPDRDFWIRLAQEGAFLFLHEALARYRIHDKSTSYRSWPDDVAREYLTVLDDFFAGSAANPRLKQEAYGRAYLVLCRNALRSGRFKSALTYYAEACATHPPLRSIGVKWSLLRNLAGMHIRSLRQLLRKASPT
jgi:glycosyltransferase involved in cell wall biosynthesis